MQKIVERSDMEGQRERAERKQEGIKRKKEKETVHQNRMEKQKNNNLPFRKEGGGGRREGSL